MAISDARSSSARPSATHMVPERRTLSEMSRRSGSSMPRTASMALSSAFPKSE